MNGREIGNLDEVLKELRAVVDTNKEFAEALGINQSLP